MKYYITSEQLQCICDLVDGFETNANSVEQVCCSDEPIINYGFKLGQIHTYIREHYHNGTQLINKIYKQKVKDS